MNENVVISRETSRTGRSGVITRDVQSDLNTPAKAPNTRRLNINLPEAKFSELEQLARDSHRTMTDVVRIALELVKIAVNLEEHSHKLAVVNSEGELIKEIVLLR
jgi:hypothetical protein